MATNTPDMNKHNKGVSTTGTIAGYGMQGSPKLNVTMQLFGLPYQFLRSVDQRQPEISNNIGRKYVDNIIMDSQVVTIIPGEPRYLPAVHDKVGYTNALLAAANGNFSELRNIKDFDEDQIKLYDFQSAFIKYYQYVNVLCRVAAGYLELGKETNYKINGQVVDFLKYDWKNYRWNGKQYTSVIGGIAKAAKDSVVKSIIKTGSKIYHTVTTKKGKEKKVTSKGVEFGDPTAGKSNDELDDAENLLKNTNFIQFYAEADGNSGSESLTNSTQQSMFKQLLDQGSSGMRDIAFMANSGGVDVSKLGQLGDSALSALENAFGGSGTVNGAVGGILSRLLSTGKSVIKGENIMMPDIWAGSSNSKSYELTLKFKAMYGARLCNYVDVIVPTLHCVALAYPRGTTANSFASPPLVKVYKRGEWTCNLGMVSSIEIVKSENPDAYSIDAIAMETTVRMSITDLYTDVALTPPNDAKLFASNSSLVEFLATTCGLDLVQPQLKKKITTMWNITVQGLKDIPGTALGKVTESFDRALSAFTGL